MSTVHPNHVPSPERNLINCPWRPRAFKRLSVVASIGIIATSSPETSATLSHYIILLLEIVLSWPVTRSDSDFNGQNSASQIKKWPVPSGTTTVTQLTMSLSNEENTLHCGVHSSSSLQQRKQIRAFLSIKRTSPTYTGNSPTIVVGCWGSRLYCTVCISTTVVLRPPVLFKSLGGRLNRCNAVALSDGGPLLHPNADDTPSLTCLFHAQ